MSPVFYHVLMALLLVLIIVLPYAIPNVFTFWHYMIFAGGYGAYLGSILLIQIIKYEYKKRTGRSMEI